MSDNNTLNRRSPVQAKIAIVVLGLLFSSATLLAQDIRTDLTVYDNVGNSRFLSIGINAAATEGIDPALGEYSVFPPAPLSFDARLVDTDIRLPNLLNDGVLLDLRPLSSPGPIIATYELRVQRFFMASSMTLRWTFPFATGVTSARLTAYPNASILNVDMSTVGQVVLPSAANRYLITVTYDGPALRRYTLNTTVAPAGQGIVIVNPMQPDYAYGSTVTLTAAELAPPDDCYAFARWSGDASGTNPVVTVTMDANKSVTARFVKKQFSIATSALAPFVVGAAPPPAQRLYISSSGGDCYTWTAVSTQPWLTISRNAGMGDDSMDVGILTAEIPCQGTHVGAIQITSAESIPATVVVPVTLIVGRNDVTATVTGSPIILSCESKAPDYVFATITNGDFASVVFPTAPQLGSFRLLNPAIFPLTILPKDSATLYFEFEPDASRRGLVVENVILTATTCGKQVPLTLTGTRIAPTVTANNYEADFGKINACTTDTLPVRSIVLQNAAPYPASLQYQIPAGIALIAAPAVLPANGSATVTMQPYRTGNAVINGNLVITTDFIRCLETLSIALHGTRQTASFIAEAAATPGSLPPQVFDTLCVGAFSDAKAIRLVNTGTADLRFTLTIAAPFEIDAFNNTVLVPAGQNRVVNVRFHPTTSGAFNQQLVIAADLCSLDATVQLHGATWNQTVLASTVNPPALSLANCEGAGTVLLTVTNTGTQVAVFATLPALPEGFAWDSSLAPPLTIRPGAANAFRTYIRFSPAMGRSGSYGGSVQWFGEPCGTAVYFTLAGDRLIPQVQIAPRTLDFGILVNCGTATAAPERVVSVLNSSTLPVLVTAFAPAAHYTISNGAQSYPTQGLTLQPNESVDITIAALNGTGGAFTDTLLITTWAGTGGACTRTTPVVLAGERYKPDYIVREGTESADFGDVCVRTTVSRSFRVENIGDMPLLVSCDGFASNSEFSLASAPYRATVDPGTTTLFTVRYTPAQAGTDFATLTFTNDACPSTNATFSVRGRGVSPAIAVTSVTPAGPITLLSCEKPLTREIRATIQNTSGDAVTVTDATMPPAGFRFDPPGQFPFLLQGGTSRDVTLQFVGTAPGSYSGAVTVSGAPCAVQASFALQVTIIGTGYTVEPRSIDFGVITICPSGEIREKDLPKLVRDVVVRNTGELAISVGAAVQPGESPVHILLPATLPISIPPGKTATITVGIVPPIGGTLDAINAALLLTIGLSPDTLCAPAVVTIPCTADIDRINARFVDDSLVVATACAPQIVPLQAPVINEGTAAVTFSAALAGSRAFMLLDTSLTLAPGARGIVHLRYNPSTTEPPSVELVLTESRCGTELRLPIRIEHSSGEVILAGPAGTESGSTQYTSRPGDIIQIPFFLLNDVNCPTQSATLSFELLHDVYAMTPAGAVTDDGTAQVRMSGPGRTTVSVTRTQFTAGPLVTVRMEMLAGKTKITSFSVANAFFTPDLATVTPDSSCGGRVVLGPRNGITTLGDLGISVLAPLRPNTLPTRQSSTATIEFSVPEDGHATITLYNALGNEVATAFSGWVSRGVHAIVYDPGALPNGLYHVILASGRDVSAQKLLIAR